MFNLFKSKKRSTPIINKDDSGEIVSVIVDAEDTDEIESWEESFIKREKAKLKHTAKEVSDVISLIEENKGLINAKNNSKKVDAKLSKSRKAVKSHLSNKNFSATTFETLCDRLHKSEKASELYHSTIRGIEHKVSIEACPEDMRLDSYMGSTYFSLTETVLERLKYYLNNINKYSKGDK